jgi:hypothetical protein
VAIDGDVVVVHDWVDAAPGAQVFRRSANDGMWRQEATLKSPLDPGFGGIISGPDGVAVQGDMIALCVLELPFGTPKVFVFQHDPATSTWTLVSSLTHPPEAPGLFGSAVDFDGDLLVVGGLRGGPLVYHHDPITNDWLFEAALGEPSIVGSSSWVAVSGDVVVFSGGVFDGARIAWPVFVYRYEGGLWQEEDILYPANSGLGPDLLLADSYGLAGDAEGDRIFVIANGIFTYAGEHLGGAVYLYRHVNGRWLDEGIIREPDFSPTGLGTSSFGSSAALNGNRLVVSAERFDGDGIDSGAAYFFSGLLSPDDDGDGVPDECAIAIRDMNDDGLLDARDLVYLVHHFGVCDDCRADLNGDGVVDRADLHLLLLHFTRSPTPRGRANRPTRRR